MNARFQQDARMGSFSTVLGKDVLNLLRFEGEEHLNGLFSYRVEALANTDDLDFNTLISTHATVSLKSFDLPDTPFDGIITEGEMLGQGDNGWRYAFTLKPWFWLLGLRRKQQIYHEKTVVQILDELFGPYSGLGKPAVEKRLTGSYPTLEYTVQYRESDLDFATRLMERFGISYHFKHDTGSHTLVLTDTAISHDDLPGGSRAFQLADNGNRIKNEEHFWDMRPSQRLTTGKIRLTDYNFKTPNAAMETDRDGAAPYAEGGIESYDYPGDYLAQGPGNDVARLRVEQERGQDPRHRAVGDCASLRAGQKVKITGDKVPGVDKTLCLSARHAYTSGGYGTNENSEPSYEGNYLLMPANAPLAPERKTARPIVQGPQTAVVVGDGEIDCDEYGRIWVRFHWDLDGRNSMRCRVSQNWAGKGWGGMIIPRIGMEVMVEFLEGDPDKPVVTGCVYNGKNDVPYPLPEHKTRSTFKTDTHKGTGFNELRFEDEKDKEEIFVHGQKDRNTKIENNQSERVNVNKVESIGHNKSSEIGNNLIQIVDGNMEVRVGPGNTGSVTPSGASKAPEGLGEIPDGIGKPGSSMKGEGMLSVSVERSKSQTIGENHNEIVEDNKVSQVGKDYRLEVGKTVLIEAGDKISLVCGKSTLTMTDNGTISINGKKIMQLGDDLIRLLSDTVKIN
jgi:type VI secretion system secreted protein VgrG